MPLVLATAGITYGTGIIGWVILGATTGSRAGMFMRAAMASPAAMKTSTPDVRRGSSVGPETWESVVH